MKRKIIYITLILIILLLIGAGIYWYIKNNKDVKGVKITPNDPAIEALINYQQRKLSVTKGIIKESSQQHDVYLYMEPSISLNVKEKTIKEVKITNFKGYSSIGEFILIAPSDENTSDCKNQIFGSCKKEVKYEDMKDAGKSITYSVVDNPKRYNEVANKFQIAPKFAIILKNLGSVNYEQRMEAEGYFDNNKYLEYLNIPADKYNIRVQFDLEIKFEDGTQYSQRFGAVIDGNELLSDPLYSTKLLLIK